MIGYIKLTKGIIMLETIIAIEIALLIFYYATN